MGIVSLRAYARHRGVSLRAVQKAIGSGRIEKTAGGQIDIDAADAQWSSRTAPRPAGTSNRARPPERSPNALQTSQVPIPPGEPRPDARSELPPATGVDYSRARAVRENYLARLAKIDYEERTGKLVSKDEVQVAAFNRFRQFRDQMLNIPDRLSALLAAETDPGKVYDVLASEIRKALNEFASANS
jgi:hypothetical protein